MLSQVHTFLAETAARALPRILTQISRDPGAPFHGACDRNWWHYKIRDFPSIILQQAGYALAIAADLPRGAHASSVPLSASCGESSSFHSLAAAAARFWNQRAIRHGAFEEYYPYEQGYPPAAFSTLAVAKLCHMDIVPLEDIRPGLEIAARQLLSRFEAQAANQQIAGTAALAVIRTIAPDLVPESRFKRILDGVLALQLEEGWFPEYDGPDLGYLAVSIDCLYDIHDHTADPRILPAIRKAADFISWFALSPIGGAGMHNSRNTDYITPYGLVRLALEEKQPAHIATVQQFFTRNAARVRDQASGGRRQEAEVSGSQSQIHNLQSPIPYHFFDAIDDRYWCHYIGHSVLRALLLLENRGWDYQSQSSWEYQPKSGWDYESQSVLGTTCPQPSASSSLSPAPCPQPPTETPKHRAPQAQLGSGHALLTSPAGATTLVSTRKGGITTAIWPDGTTANDFGWIVETAGKSLVSHWWSNDWTISIDDTRAACEGWLVPHKEHLSAPWKHIALRVASFLAGRRLIKLLKRLVIFKKPLQSHRFTREVAWDGDILVIRDTIEGLSPSDRVTRAPRTSKRHVASADGFHPEDLAMLVGVERSETVSRTDEAFECKTRYQVVVGS